MNADGLARRMSLDRIREHLRHAETDDITRRAHTAGIHPTQARSELAALRACGIDPAAAHESLAVLIARGWRPPTRKADQ